MGPGGAWERLRLGPAVSVEKVIAKYNSNSSEKLDVFLLEVLIRQVDPEKVGTLEVVWRGASLSR